MLTYEASITFAPHSTVTGLSLSLDGTTIAWSESNGSVNIYQTMEKVYEIKCDGIITGLAFNEANLIICLLYTSPSPRDATLSRMPSSA